MNKELADKVAMHIIQTPSLYNDYFYLLNYTCKGFNNCAGTKLADYVGEFSNGLTGFCRAVFRYSSEFDSWPVEALAKYIVGYLFKIVLIDMFVDKYKQTIFIGDKGSYLFGSALYSKAENGFVSMHFVLADDHIQCYISFAREEPSQNSRLSEQRIILGTDIMGSPEITIPCGELKREVIEDLLKKAGL